MTGIDPITKRQLEISKFPRWIFFTLGTSFLPILIRMVLLVLTSQEITLTSMRSELFFLVVVCMVDTIKNCRHHSAWVLVITFALILCSIIYGVALADYLNLLNVDLFASFDVLMIVMVLISIILDGFTTAKYGD